MAEIIENASESLVVETPIQDELLVGNIQVVRATYIGVDTDNIEMNVDNENKTISASLVQTQYASKSQFPAVGSDKLLYVDLSDDSVWRWDVTQEDYVLLNDTSSFGASLDTNGTWLYLLNQNGDRLSAVQTQDTGVTSVGYLLGEGTQDHYFEQYNKYTTFTSTSDYVGFYVKTKRAGLWYDYPRKLVTNDNKDSLGIDAGVTPAYTRGNAVTDVDAYDRTLFPYSAKTFVEVNDIDDSLSASSRNPVQNKVIAELIPAQASSSNKLVDTNTMNSSIATATATFRGTYNVVTDLSLTPSATQSQIATALASAVSTADNNDYCFVQIPTAVGTPTEIARIDRYKYDGTNWSFEYSLNNSSFTASQWEAINSGITNTLVTKLNGIEAGAQVNTITGVKGNAEQNYRTGNISIDPDDLDDTNTTNKFVTASDKQTWNAKQDALPTTTTAGQVLKSTSTAGAVEWGSVTPTLPSSVAYFDDTNFQNMSWERISELAYNEDFKNFFSVGDEKTIELSNGETITLVILDMYHDNLTSGGKSALTIGMKDCLQTSYLMDADFSDPGGIAYSTSDMRNDTLPAIFMLLPEDLRSVIKYVDKESMDVDNSVNPPVGNGIIVTSEKLFLLSLKEILGQIPPGHIADEEYEGTQYAYWAEHATSSDRIKTYDDNGTPTACTWWTRSIASPSGDYFSCFSSLGTYNWAPSNTNGIRVSFAFCI